MIRRLIARIKFWIVEYRLNREIENSIGGTGTSTQTGGALGLDTFNSNLDSIHIVQDQTQRKYAHGMACLKEAILEQTKDGKGLHQVLSQYQGEEGFYLNPDLLSLARRENNSEKSLRETRLSMIAGKGVDVKSEEDHKKMIDKRIQVMYTVQKDKLKRKLLSEIRIAKQSGNTGLVKKLEKEFYEKYTR